MIVFPAVDLRGGRAVRLYQGDFSQETVYRDDPMDAVRAFMNAGATHLHLVDLDGARTGEGMNRDIIARIAGQSGLFVQVGGGIRDMAAAESCLALGVSRVILGTAAVEDPTFLRRAAINLGDRMAVGVDIRDGRVATRGWTGLSDLSADAFFDTLFEAGVKTVVVTDISRDGAMRGANHALYRSLQARRQFQVVASGGVSTLKDVKRLREMQLYGAIIGKALYTGDMDLKLALEESA